MKKIFIFFAAALLAVPSAFSADAIDVIMKRKSVRSYERGKISDKHLQTILKAGMAAPSAMDKRPWEFIVIDDYAVLDALAEKLPHAKMLKEAGAAIVVCGREDKENFWITDCSAATENILLAVEALKLGAVWTAVYPDKERIAAVSKILNIPKGFIPLNVIPIGKPKGVTKHKNKHDLKKIHTNKW
jgi:nitroreductase